MQCAVAKCPKVCISAHGIQIPSLLDSSSKVTLLWQSYFVKHILPKIKLATGEKANTHSLFKLTVANDGQIPPKTTCLVEQAQHHDLPLGIVINRCVATTKARSVPVILVNTTKQNVWIWQPLLATELFNTDQIDEIEHRASMERQGDNINISFLPVTPNFIRVKSEQVESTTPDITPPTSNEKPSFGPRPDVKAVNFDFQAEIDHPPFKLNMGTTVYMTHEQQSQFINLIYDHPEVFSLHDEHLGFCNKIKHMIPITLDRPFYLPHCTIPPQLLGEVYKCLDTWLRQGIIRPSQSPYAS